MMVILLQIILSLIQMSNDCTILEALRARALSICVRVRRPYLGRPLSPFLELGEAFSVFALASLSPKYAKTIKRLRGSYCSLIKFYCFMFIPCSNLQSFTKAFPVGVVPAFNCAGVVHCTHRTYIPCHMVRNDIFFNM